MEHPSNLWSSTFLDLLNSSNYDHTKDMVSKFSCVLNTAYSLLFTPTAIYYKSHPFLPSLPSQSLIPPPEFRSLLPPMVPHTIICLYYIPQSFPLKDKPLSEIIFTQSLQKRVLTFRNGTEDPTRFTTQPRLHFC